MLITRDETRITKGKKAENADPPKGNRHQLLQQWIAEMLLVVIPPLIASLVPVPCALLLLAIPLLHSLDFLLLRICHTRHAVEPVVAG